MNTYSEQVNDTTEQLTEHTHAASLGQVATSHGHLSKGKGQSNTTLSSETFGSCLG